MRPLILSIVTLTLFFGQAFTLRGQEKSPAVTDPAKPAEPSPPATSAPAGTAASGTTVAPAGKANGPHEIYLPFKFLKGIFDSQGASVVVPLDEYKRLKEAADKPQLATPSVTAVITSANYVATIEQDPGPHPG